MKLFRGEIWHVKHNPFQRPGALESFMDGALVVDAQGKILQLGEFSQLSKAFPQAQVMDYRDHILIPGFIDAHLHMPQLHIIGSHGDSLLNWLNRYTFKEEERFKDEDYAQKTAKNLLQELLHNGTTTACIFSSSHKEATEKLFQEAENAQIRAIIGKVSMDRHAPKGLLHACEQDVADSKELIERWHGKNGKLFYALTPRFAPSCSQEMMKRLSKLMEKSPDLYLQTHLSETTQEVAWVKDLFPEQKNYLDVYAEYGFVHRRSLFAHGIHLEENEKKLLAEKKASVVHCPSSNLFLGSGLCPVQELEEQGVQVALGSDIGAGTSLSLWKTLLDAYKVSALLGTPLSVEGLFYLATLGGACALGFETVTGNFLPGKFCDMQILSPQNLPLLKSRFHRPLSVEEKFFALVTLGDERMVEGVVMEGKLRL